MLSVWLQNCLARRNSCFRAETVHWSPDGERVPFTVGPDDEHRRAQWAPGRRQGLHSQRAGRAHPQGRAAHSRWHHGAAHAEHTCTQRSARPARATLCRPGARGARSPGHPATLAACRPRHPPPDLDGEPFPTVAPQTTGRRPTHLPRPLRRLNRV